MDDSGAIVRAEQIKAKKAPKIGTLLRRLGFQEYSDIESLSLTGTGAHRCSDADEIGRSVPIHYVPEFDAVGLGGLALTGLSKALVVSLGTGTAFVVAEDGNTRHIGGTGIGGGTLLGLGPRLFGDDDIYVIAGIAEHGDLSNVDLLISDITDVPIPGLPMHATAANFAKVSPNAADADFALGLINMLFQTIGTLAVFACGDKRESDVIVTGTMASLPQAERIFGELTALYGTRFVIPEQPAFATALGAVLGARRTGNALLTSTEN